MGLAYLANPSISLMGRQGLEPPVGHRLQGGQSPSCGGSGEAVPPLYLNTPPAILLAQYKEKSRGAIRVQMLARMLAQDINGVSLFG